MNGNAKLDTNWDQNRIWHDRSFFNDDHEKIIEFAFRLGGAGRNEVEMINFETEIEDFDDDEPDLLQL